MSKLVSKRTTNFHEGSRMNHLIPQSEYESFGERPEAQFEMRHRLAEADTCDHSWMDAGGGMMQCKKCGTKRPMDKKMMKEAEIADLKERISQLEDAR